MLGDVICREPGDSYKDSQKCWPANARLISASPKMYDYIADRAKEGDPHAAAIIASIG